MRRIVPVTTGRETSGALTLLVKRKSIYQPIAVRCPSLSLSLYIYMSVYVITRLNLKLVSQGKSHHTTPLHRRITEDSGEEGPCLC